MLLKPGKCLERTLAIIRFVFAQAGVKDYWLHFGGLIALAKKNGVVPDGDFDLCTYYENNDKFKKIVKVFESKGWVMSKAIQNDIDKDKVLYCGFNWGKHQTNEIYNSGNFMPHICLSFWYLHKGIRYYCHDEKHELSGGAIGKPPSGYFFKGFEDKYIHDESMIMRAEWPGIPGNVRIDVPILPCLEQMYPAYIYNQQRYIVQEHNVQEDKLRDCCRSGAISRYSAHLTSMADWQNDGLIKGHLENSERKWRIRLKSLKRK